MDCSPRHCMQDTKTKERVLSVAFLGDQSCVPYKTGHFGEGKVEKAGEF